MIVLERNEVLGGHEATAADHYENEIIISTAV